jgi:hypothetical protein
MSFGEFAMKFNLWVILFAASVSAQSQDTAYPLTATVQSSHVSIRCDDVRNGQSQCSPYLEISAVISGRHLEMEGGKARQGYLAPGDYKAKLVSDEHKKPYFTQQEYEIQYPDGATEKFRVIGESK